MPRPVEGACLAKPNSHSNENRVHGKTYLPSAGQEAEGTREKSPSRGKAATSVSAYQRRRCGKRGLTNRRRGASRPEFRDRRVRLPSSPEALRQERADRLRRERAASDALRVAYPALEQLRFELTFESPSPNTPAAQSHVLHPAARAFFEFSCPYADCDGGFDLTSAVSTALTRGGGRARGALECGGHRPERHGSRRPCKLHLTYAIAATYLTGE